jgi:GT2 family glycosyltransferase
MMPAEICVVIPTYRRPALLRRCLMAVVTQSLDADRYEVVVVDDGRDDATHAVVRDVAALTGGAPRLRYLQPGGTRGPAGARNVGWRATRAPLVAFTDDDTVPDRHWLREGCDAMRAGWVAAAGRVRVPAGPAPTDHARMTQGLERAEFVTANAFVRRSALDAVGGFDERYTRAWREDSDLHFSLMRLGQVGRARRAVVEHPVRDAPWGISLRQQANVAFDALLYKKHPDLYRERIRRRPPWHYLVIVVATLAALAAALAGQGGVAAGCAAVAAAGALRFARQRLRGASHAPAHVAEMVVTSFAIPFLALYWRAVGAWRYRVLFP